MPLAAFAPSRCFKGRLLGFLESVVLLSRTRVLLRPRVLLWVLWWSKAPLCLSLCVSLGRSVNGFLSMSQA